MSRAKAKSGRRGGIRLVISLTLLPLIGSVLQGCATFRVQQFIYRGSHPAFELSTKPGVYEGDYLGVDVKRARRNLTQQLEPNVECHHYQFAGLLAGQIPRFLQLYIPVEPDNTFIGIMEESEAPVSDKRRAPVWFVVGEAHAQLGGSDLLGVLSSRDGLPVSSWGKQPYLIEWPGAGNPAVHVRCHANGASVSSQSIAEDRLRRVQRSRLRPAMGPLLYLISVPFDAITAPVQAVIWVRGGGPG